MRPVPGQGPPGRVQQKGLVETVVTRKEVHAPAIHNFDFRSRTDIPEFQALKHSASRGLMSLMTAMDVVKMTTSLWAP